MVHRPQVTAATLENDCSIENWTKIKYTYHQVIESLLGRVVPGEKKG